MAVHKQQQVGAKPPASWIRLVDMGECPSHCLGIIPAGCTWTALRRRGSQYPLGFPSASEARSGPGLTSDHRGGACKQAGSSPSRSATGQARDCCPAAPKRACLCRQALFLRGTKESVCVGTRCSLEVDGVASGPLRPRPGKAQAKMCWPPRRHWRDDATLALPACMSSLLLQAKCF